MKIVAENDHVLLESKQFKVEFVDGELFISAKCPIRLMGDAISKLDKPSLPGNIVNPVLRALGGDV